MAIKVLNIFTGHQGHEGITSVWLDYVKAIHRSTDLTNKLQMDVVAMDGMYDEDYFEWFESENTKIHRLPNRKKHPIKYLIALFRLIHRAQSTGKCEIS